MTNEEKVEKIKALIEEINELSKELSEEELKAVAGGGGKTPEMI
jgi:bacteriocin-like protein